MPGEQNFHRSGGVARPDKDDRARVGQGSAAAPQGGAKLTDSAFVVDYALQTSLGVKFEGVEKRYGSLRALRRVTLSIAPGEFVALFGPNGSGKTTLLRMAALLARPTKGRVTHIGAENLRSEDVRRQIGLVGHKALIYDELTARENLAFFAQLYGLTGRAERVDRVLQAVGLAQRADDAAGTFSRGMRQRLAIARALISEPRLLLFDEPSTGLDRQGREWLEQTLSGLHQAGATLIVSSHDELLTTLAKRSIWLRAGQVERDSAGEETRLAPGVRP